METYLPRPEAGSDYEHIRRNGMWYQQWQAGYSDILKKGHPQPSDPDTILAELHSPLTDDFLHGGSGVVPFLISERAKTIFEESELKGYRLASVEIAKIAAKGKTKRKISSGEPESAILSRRDVKSTVSVPTLYAVYITGRVQAIPDFSLGSTPSGSVSPFELSLDAKNIPDLFIPELDGKRFSAWSFCSDRFRIIIERARLTNITFQSFDEFMTEFRAKTGS